MPINPAVPTIEAGQTTVFAWVGSTSPDSAPKLSVWNPANTVLVSLQTMAQSDATHYYGLYTAPVSADGVYLAETLALKTVSGSAYNNRQRMRFAVLTTLPD